MLSAVSLLHRRESLLRRVPPGFPLHLAQFPSSSSGLPVVTEGTSRAAVSGARAGVACVPDTGSGVGPALHPCGLTQGRFQSQHRMSFVSAVLKESFDRRYKLASMPSLLVKRTRTLTLSGIPPGSSPDCGEAQVANMHLTDYLDCPSG